jgi:class 3 adenylate cyclase/tetratricopeptide (TPR) repeat protein
MRCGACGQDNRSERRFCGGCGAALAAACARCGFANLPGERFCGGCGGGLEAAAPAGERRQVAILFADLAGYTRLSTTLDPEEVHRLLTGFFEVVDGTCTRFGGTIDKHIGDNVMAIFGAPVAHGDDPERAVRAAVEIHRGVAAYSERAGRELKVHVGIAYGEVMASGLGSSHHTEYTMTGDAVNLAARLQDKAVGGETLISDAVLRAAARIAVAEPVGDVTVKGLATPVAVWRLVDVRAPVASSARVIGRDVELARIEAALGSGSGPLIVVRGEPGIGKSTLVAEMSRRAGERFAIHAAQVLDFGAGRGAGAIPTLVASLLDGSLDDAVAAGRVSTDDAPHLANLLELESASTADIEESERRDRQHAALAALIASAATPPLLVVEDVHWADAATAMRLRHAIAAVHARAGAVVATTRIDGDPIDAAWRAAAGGAVVEIDLEPLPGEDAARIAASHLEDADLIARCVERAGGNPLFLEQLVHAATRDATLPGTLQGVVLARVDRLAARDKAALHAAAVAGQRFSLALVRVLCADPAWQPDEVIARRLVARTDDADDLRFHHALILDGIYASLTHARRRELHRAAAAWYADRDPVPRAEHLERAGDPAAAAAWLAAAEAHAALHDADRALELIDRGLEAARASADRYALHALAGRLRVDVAGSVTGLADWTAALEAAPDDVARCRALIGIATVHRISTAAGPAMRALDEAHPLAERHDLALELAQIEHYRGAVTFALGDVDAVAAHHERSLAHARRAGSAEWEVRALSGLGDALYARGRFADAANAFMRCTELADRLGMRRYALVNRAMYGDSIFYLLRAAESVRVLREVAEEARGLRAARAELLALESLSLMATLAWRTDDGVTVADESLRLSRALGVTFFELTSLIALVEIHASRGDRATARRWLDDAIACAATLRSAFLEGAIEGLRLRLSDDPAERAALRGRGATLASRAAIGVSMFHRNAIEAAIEHGEWDTIDAAASALEALDAPYTSFVAARGRAWARWGLGERSAALDEELARLRAVADAGGLMPAWPG